MQLYSIPMHALYMNEMRSMHLIEWNLICFQFLGSTPVDQAKGIETVKDAIRRLQFSQQMKKAESGSNVKTKKVEITISVDGVAIQVSIHI